MTTRTIIVGYDRSPDATAAAMWALDEAARTGAPVQFLYAYEWPTWLPAASTVPAPAVWPDAETEQAVDEVLHAAVTTASQTHPSVNTSLATVHNSAALTLIDRSTNAGLIVLGCRGHSAVTGLLGSVSVAVSAHAHCPVVVVRGTPTADAPAADAPAADAPVVVGVDDSPSASAVLGFAVEQALARHVGLHVVRAWRPVTGLWEETPMATRTVTADERREFDDLIAGWQAKHPELDITADAVVRHPAAALVDASTQAQLLVVGTRGRGAVRGMLLGSVSQHLLRHSACTVAIVHGAQT